MTAIDVSAQAALARRSLRRFAAHMDERFACPPPHLRLIIEELERIERAENRFLMINLPPRHAKTTICSQLFPAFALGRRPGREIVLASHSVDLAERNSRNARNFVARDAWPFPNVRLARDSTAATRWNVEHGGSCRALGVGSDILGRGADILIVDDALNDAFSESECETAARWFTEQAFTRLNAGGSVIIIGQRLSDNDLCGRILETDLGPKFRIVNLPALAEEGDPLGRAIGQPLWPEVFSLAELEIRRAVLGSRAFETQYQGHPTPAGGVTFRAEWLEHRYPGGIPPGALISVGLEDGTSSASYRSAVHVVMGVDTASKIALSNDYSAIATVASDERDYYVVDMVRERLEFNDLARRIVEVYHRYRHSRVFIEDTIHGAAIIQELRRQTRLPIIAVPARSSKIARAEATTPLWEAGRVKLPERASWLSDFILELTRFPSGKHDDQVDATLHALTELDKALSQYFWQRSPTRQLSTTR